MRPVSLILNNFGPFGEGVEVDFLRYGDEEQILIVGENRDSAGADSNGSGKSYLFNSMSWALFGKIPNDVEAGEVVNRKSNKCGVIFTLLDEDNNNYIRIERTRKNTGKHQLSYWIYPVGDTYDGNEDYDKTLRKKSLTEPALLKHFGILENNVQYYNDFLNTTYFSIDAVKAFAGKHSTSKDRMDLISRFLNLSILDRCHSRTKVLANNAKTDVGGVESKLQFLRNRIDEDFDKEETEKKIKSLKRSIINLEKETEEFQEQLNALALVKNLQDQLGDTESAIERADDGLEEAKENYDERLEELNLQLEEIDSKKDELEQLENTLEELDYVDLAESIDSKEQTIKDGTTTTGKRQQELDNIINQIEEQLECPACNEDLMLTDDHLELFNVEDLKIQRKKLTAKVKKNNDLIAELQIEVDDLRVDLRAAESLEDKIELVERRISELSSIPGKIDDLKEKYKVTKNDAKEYISTLEATKLRVTIKLKKNAELDPSIHSDLEVSIDSNKKKIENDKDDVSRLKIQIETYETSIKDLEKMNKELLEFQEIYAKYAFWLEGFPAIRRWMIESFLPSFEEQINAFLNNLEAGMRVRLDTLKEKKSGKGEMKSEFDFAIIDDQNETRTLESYSSGENKRIGICVGFALRELTLSRGYSNFDFILMDEVIDSLDETGIMEFFGLIKDISGMKFLITHNTDLKTRFNNVIKVVKEEGVSTVIQT